MRRGPAVLLISLFLVGPLTAQPVCGPAPAGRNAGAWLAAAATAVGLDRVGNRVLHYQAMANAEQNYQSDRTYPPFFSAYSSQEGWADPRTGAERFRQRGVFPQTGPGTPQELLATARATWMVRDTLMRPAPVFFHQTGSDQRRLNPWAVLADWVAAGSASVVGECEYRDYPRVVLALPGGDRLFLDRKTAMPVKLERREPHYLWGDTQVEYLWSTWVMIDGVSFPSASFRLVDGAVEVARTIGDSRLMPADSAPVLVPRDPSLTMDAGAVPDFLRPDQPDTVRVGPATFLLRNRGYAEAVTLARDTVFMLEATQGEARARLDSVWIGKLFPGRHPIVVIVTDLAWPHIAGIRFWVASGATIVSHRMSRPFLERVVNRRWSTPDVLDRARRPMRFRAVSDSLALAGGAVTLHPIDGIGSEGALMAWLPSDRFLWASDYIQDFQNPTQYLAEVRAAVARIGVRPARVGAQHIPLTDWAKLEGLH